MRPGSAYCTSIVGNQNPIKASRSIEADASFLPVCLEATTYAALSINFMIVPLEHYSICVGLQQDLRLHDAQLGYLPTDIGGVRLCNLNSHYLFPRYALTLRHPSRGAKGTQLIC